MSEAYRRVVRALEDGGFRQGRQFRCPAHDDHKPSLSVSEGDEGRVLLHCHAGCGSEAVVAALGLTMADLFEPNGGGLEKGMSKIVATYDYVDENGDLLFQVCRLESKSFRQRRPDGNEGWIWDLDGVRRVLYRLPRVLEAAKACETVYVVEGEKDVESIEAAGAVATCNPGGAGKWREEYSQSLVGARCIVIADDDDPGRRHAQAVVVSLRTAGIEVELLRPARGKDAADHLEQGRGLDDFVPLPQPLLAQDSDISSDEFHRSDTGNAQLFARMHGQNARYDFLRGRWLLWRGHHWVPDTDGEIYRIAEDVARKRYEDAWELSDKSEARQASGYAIGAENRTRMVAMLDLARSQVPIANSGETWNIDPMLLGVPNGVVDLRSGKLRDGRRGDGITHVTGVRYDPDAVGDRWLQFLHEVFGGDGDLIDFVQRAVGYSLTGDVGEQCLFLLHGVGANGKSTFLNAIRHVAGAYGYNMPFSTVEMRGRCAVPNDLAALVGRRLVTSSETSETTRLNESRVKALTGGDPITARFLHQEYFTFQPVGKFWLGVNHKPRVEDDSHGFWRRVRLIPFERQFPGDKNLEAQLQAEAPAILAWAVHGCLLWQKRGLDPPDCVLSATDEYRQESDPLEAFLAEQIEETGDDMALPVRDIVKAYADWASREGLGERERLGSRSLQGRLKAKWPDRHRPAVRQTPTRYVGLRLVTGDV